ncbi:MAG: HD domain-containing protein [Candidatus Sulfotelmatobacter sp.]
MSSKWPKLLHDSVHRLIVFEDTGCDRLLLDLINTREFQRLRRIKQLGFSETVFPGANHSRFAHCIGVLQMAKLFIERLKRINSKAIDEEIRTIVLCTALLHDLGHGPFSHAFEKVTRESHEARTREIVESDDTQVYKVLANHDPRLPSAIANFMRGETSSNVPGFLTHVVSSQLDSDRFDYLLRDSYAAGVDYGEFDYRWLITHLHVDVEHFRLYLSSKALLAAEAYVFARYHMYRTVYFHKTTRSAEVMLKLLFRRYGALVAEKSFKNALKVLPDAPKEVVKAFSSKLQLHDYLGLDDHSITQFCKACETSSDETLKGFGSGLLHRNYLKALDVTDCQPDAVLQFSMQATELLKGKGYDSEFSITSDSAGETAYKMYNPDSEAPNTQIYIENRDGKQIEISYLSEPVDRLRKKYALTRFYFPQDVRNDIEAIANQTLRN